MVIEPIDGGSSVLNALVDEARAEGLSHIDRLINGWRDSTNRFDKPGEVLLAAKCDDAVIGVGGLNIDPYLNEQNVGRIRHVFVRRIARRTGVGRALLRQLLASSEGVFEVVRVRAAATGGAADFYDAAGFARVNAVDASHEWRGARLLKGGR